MNVSWIRSRLREMKYVARRRLVRSGLILIYHRVANNQIDPWRLCVSVNNFASQLEVLRALNCKLVHVSHLAKKVAQGQLDRQTVAITFDDGYHDNLENARPLLERYGAPAALFASAGYIGSDEEFWWDVLERIFLEPGLLPDVLELEVKGQRYRRELGSAAHFSDKDALRWPQWKPLRDPPTMRHRLHDELWRLLFDSVPAERTRIVAALQQWGGIERHARSDRRPLSADELRRLSGDGLVEIGAHGMTHSALASLSRDMQALELRESKGRLEELIGKPVLGCSFPQGGTSLDTENEIRDAGYAFACGSDAHSVKTGANQYQLPRVSPGDWNAAKFKSFVEAHLAA